MERLDNFDGKGRFYVHPVTGKKLKSTTNVLDTVVPKPWMGPWAAKVEREQCMRIANTVYESLNGDRVSPREFKKRLKLAMPDQKAHKTIAKEASNIGGKAHDLIDWRLRGELGLERGDEPELEEPSLWAVAGFEDWRRKVKFKPLHSEIRLYSDDLEAAGTADCIACELEIHVLAPKPRRVVALGDWKTSAAIRESHFIQVAVYRHMAIERGILDDNAWGLILRLPKKVGDPPFEHRLIQPSRCRELVEVFRHACGIWDWYVLGRDV